MRKHNPIRKLTEDEIAEIRRLFRRGVKMPELAEQFGVHSKAIKFWVDDEYRERRRRQNKERYARCRSKKVEPPPPPPRLVFLPETRDLTGILMGDPPPERSALARLRQAEN